MPLRPKPRTTSPGLVSPKCFLHAERYLVATLPALGSGDGGYRADDVLDGLSVSICTGGRRPALPGGIKSVPSGPYAHGQWQLGAHAYEPQRQVIACRHAVRIGGLAPDEEFADLHGNDAGLGDAQPPRNLGPRLGKSVQPKRYDRIARRRATTVIFKSRTLGSHGSLRLTHKVNLGVGRRGAINGEWTGVPGDVNVEILGE